LADDVLLINIDDGVKRLMNNTKIYINLLAKFIDDKSYNEMTAALETGGMEKAKAAVHTLKGIAANLSLIELHKQSKELEEQIKKDSVEPAKLEFIKDIYNKTLLEAKKVIEQYG
jgi:HPt (histidine-containing phosphotransfer) domain-containing protein